MRQQIQREIGSKTLQCVSTIHVTMQSVSKSKKKKRIANDDVRPNNVIRSFPSIQKSIAVLRCCIGYISIVVHYESAMYFFGFSFVCFSFYSNEIEYILHNRRELVE